MKVAEKIMRIQEKIQQLEDKCFCEKNERNTVPSKPC